MTVRVALDSLRLHPGSRLTEAPIVSAISGRTAAYCRVKHPETVSPTSRDLTFPFPASGMGMGTSSLEPAQDYYRCVLRQESRSYGSVSYSPENFSVFMGEFSSDHARFVRRNCPLSALSFRSSRREANRRLPGSNVGDNTLMRSARIQAYAHHGGYEPGVSSDSGLEFGKQFTLSLSLLSGPPLGRLAKGGHCPSRARIIR